MESAINTTENGKAPGCDLIPNEILKLIKPILSAKIANTVTKA